MSLCELGDDFLIIVGGPYRQDICEDWVDLVDIVCANVIDVVPFLLGKYMAERCV